MSEPSSSGTIIIGEVAPLRRSVISSVSQTLRASRRYLLLKPISTLSPWISARILSFAVPRAVVLEILIESVSKIHLT